MTGKDIYYRHAGEALKAFSLRAESQGILSGYYFASLDAYFNMVKLSINTTENELTRTAISYISPYTSIVYGEDRGYVVPCLKDVCLEPVYSAESLGEFFKNYDLKGFTGK